MSEEQQHWRGTKQQCRTLGGQHQQRLQRWCWQPPGGGVGVLSLSWLLQRPSWEMRQNWQENGCMLLRHCSSHTHRCCGCCGTGCVPHGALWASALHDAEVCPYHSASVICQFTAANWATSRSSRPSAAIYCSKYSLSSPQPLRFITWWITVNYKLIAVKSHSAAAKSHQSASLSLSAFVSSLLKKGNPSLQS